MSQRASNSTTSRYYTALARLLGSRRDTTEAGTSRSWLITKQRRGQEAWEIYSLAVLIGTTAVAAAFEQASRHIPLSGWHWLWIAPCTLAAAFVGFQLIVVGAAIVGSVLGSCGFMPSSPPGARTSFFFLSALTGYAAWAATSKTWVAPLGYLWLTLVSLNIVASVWLAMREHEKRH